MKNYATTVVSITTAAVAAAILLPTLGLTDFFAMDEAREATVAASIVEGGSWLLPQSVGGDLSACPPLYHMLVALVSLPWGEVSECSSRVPAALSFIVLAVVVCRFMMHRWSRLAGVMSSVAVLTTWGLHVDAVACAPEMLTTMFAVGAMLSLYRWFERGGAGTPWCAAVCMTLAGLSGHLLAVVLPSVVVGSTMALRGECSRRSLRTMLISTGAAMAPTAMWYVAAFVEGGTDFADVLAAYHYGSLRGITTLNLFDHNLAGTMAYAATGFVPWLVFIALAVVMRPRRSKGDDVAAPHLLDKLRRASRPAAFAATGAALLFVLALLPTGHHDVSLACCHVFVAMLVGHCFDRMARYGRHAAAAATTAIAGVAGIAFGVMFHVLQSGAFSHILFAAGKADARRSMLRALYDITPDTFETIVMTLPAVVGVAALGAVVVRRLRRSVRVLATAMTAVFVSIYVAVDAVCRPTMLAVVSLREMSDVANRVFGSQKLYSHISRPAMHFFGASFYIDRPITPFEKAVRNAADRPVNGVVMVPEKDSQAFTAAHPDYVFTRRMRSLGHPSEIRDRICFYRFILKSRQGTADDVDPMSLTIDPKTLQPVRPKQQ